MTCAYQMRVTIWACSIYKRRVEEGMSTAALTVTQYFEMSTYVSDAVLSIRMTKMKKKTKAYHSATNCLNRDVQRTPKKHQEGYLAQRGRDKISLRPHQEVQICFKHLHLQIYYSRNKLKTLVGFPLLYFSYNLPSS